MSLALAQLPAEARTLLPASNDEEEKCKWCFEQLCQILEEGLDTDLHLSWRRLAFMMVKLFCKTTAAEDAAEQLHKQEEQDSADQTTSTISRNDGIAAMANRFATLLDPMAPMALTRLPLPIETETPKVRLPAPDHFDPTPETMTRDPAPVEIETAKVKLPSFKVMRPTSHPQVSFDTTPPATSTTPAHSLSLAPHEVRRRLAQSDQANVFSRPTPAESSIASATHPLSFAPHQVRRRLAQSDETNAIPRPAPAASSTPPVTQSLSFAPHRARRRLAQADGMGQ